MLGAIRYGPAEHELSCTVIDLISRGAGIVLASTFGVPTVLSRKTLSLSEMKFIIRTGKFPKEGVPFFVSLINLPHNQKLSIGSYSRFDNSYIVT